MPYVGIGKFIAIGLNYSDHAGGGIAGADRAGGVHESHQLHQRAERRGAFSRSIDEDSTGRLNSAS